MKNLIDEIVGISSDLKKAIKNAEKIKILRLDYPKYDLNIFGKEMLKFKNLKEFSIKLDVHYPYTLPSEIGQLKGLKKFHVLNLSLLEFPDWLLNLTNLEDLMLRGNEIEVIPTRICELISLEHLRIENTEIGDLPYSIKSLTNLKSLSLVDNFKLRTIDYKILPPNLKWLALTPSGISKEIIDKINEEMPNLKIGERYFG